MQLADLDAVALRPSAPTSPARGYVAYTEHFAVAADAIKALASESDFDAATRKAWFAAGYLRQLSGTDTETGQTPISPAPADLQLFHDLLLWLAPIHRNAHDNAGVTDTALLGQRFLSYAQDSLKGIQFRANIPVVGHDRMLFPDLAAAPLPLSPTEIAKRSGKSRDIILGPALWLGNRHSIWSKSRVPHVPRGKGSH